MSSSSAINRHGGGLRLSPHEVRDHARLCGRFPAAGEVEASYLDGVHVGDDQGLSSGCAVWSGLKIEAMHGGNKRDFTDAECLAVYRNICRWVGRGDEGMTFEEAFDGLRRQGYFLWAKRLNQVYDFCAIMHGPIWYGIQVTSGIQDTNGHGCPNYALPIDDLGLHATVIGAVGQVARYPGKTLATVLNSWGAGWGYKGMFQVDQDMHDRIGYAMYQVEPK